ncbi:MAG: zinc-binding dehydrogenase [Dehalococcoidia bacterium]
MKAVYIEETGGLEALKYGDRPEPEVAPGEIMLRVRASALNHADLRMREGGYRGSLPRIMGMDIAGGVAQISPEAQTDLKEGDRVIIDNRVKCGICDPCQQGIDQYCTWQLRYGVDLDGGHSEYVTAPAINVHKIADHITWHEAAAIPLAGHTAWQCMIVQGNVQPWDDVLINAAGSGVASMGIQIAKMVGARVITTAGADWKLEKAKEMGADEVINYRETTNISEKVREMTDGKGVDLVFDVVGADVWEQNLLSLKPGGRLVITGVTSGARTNMDLSILQGRPLHLMGSGGRSRRSWREMLKMFNQGELRGIVGKVFPLEAVSEAHQTMTDRDFFGKLVIES